MNKKLPLEFEFTKELKSACKTKLMKELSKPQYQNQLNDSKPEQKIQLRNQLLNTLCEPNSELDLSIVDDKKNKVHSEAVRHAFGL